MSDNVIICYKKLRKNAIVPKYANVIIRYKKLHKNAIVPKYATEGSAGVDLCASFEDNNYRVTIKPEETCVIPTGLSVEIPKGFEGQVRTRSGLSSMYGIVVLNSPGTIDSDYRGNICVILKNTHKEFPFTVHNGTRIAQLIITPVFNQQWEESTEVSTTKRGDKGFGSTGI